MNVKKRYSDNVNYNLNIFLLTNSILFWLDNSSEKLQEKIKALRQQYHFSTSSIYNNYSLMLLKL